MVQLLTYELYLGGKFHAFYIPPAEFGHFAVAKAPDLSGLLADPPGPPAGWPIQARIAAMLRRVPGQVVPELKAQVAALLDPKSIALLAIFLSALAVAQAYGVGEIVDAILVGLAWWAARWAGLLAVKDIVTSIIEAGTAQRLPAIDEAAGRFARALLVLGLVFLSKLISRAGDEENVSGLPEPKPDLSPPSLRSPPKTIAPPSPAVQNYLARSSGRLGGTATRTLNDNIATNLENSGFRVTNGAGRSAEEFIRGPDGGVNGGNYVDITATDGTNTIRIQTIDTLADGFTPTPREAAAAARIQSVFPNDQLILVPK